MLVNNQHVKDFRDSLHYIAGKGYQTGIVLRDFVSIAVYAYTQQCVNAAMRRGYVPDVEPQLYEELYDKVLKGYTAHKDKETAVKIGNEFARMISFLVLYSMETDKEAISELFEECASSSGFGQFFTPSDVVDVMAIITGIPEIDFEKYSFTNPCWISDPACGGGRTLIYPALRAPKKYRNRLAFHGIDLDKTCVEMTALNLMLFDLHGYVIHGNALTLEAYGGYRTIPTGGMALILPLSKREAEAAIRMGLRQPKKATESPEKESNSKKSTVLVENSKKELKPTKTPSNPLKLPKTPEKTKETSGAENEVQEVVETCRNLEQLNFGF